MKKRQIVASMAVAGLMLAACSSSSKPASGQAAERQQQLQSTESLVNNQPLPHFNYSQIRQNFIELETAMANGVQSTSFFFNLGVRDPSDSCPSIGAPIPYTAQLSNPDQVVNENANPVKGNSNSSGTESVIGQMDPIGIYMPPDATGTWVLCINAQGQAYANYWEGYVRSVFAPAKWNYTTHQIELIGPPSFKFSSHKGG